MSVFWKRRALLPLVGSAVLAAMAGWAPAHAMPQNQAFSSAAFVVVQLQSSRPSLALLSDFSQTTDPEHLLGLPGQYVARATFNDWALNADGGLTGIVEVFASSRDLANRRRTMVGPAGEHDFEAGPVLLRLFGVSDYDYATIAAYDTALKLVVLG